MDNVHCAILVETEAAWPSDRQASAARSENKSFMIEAITSISHQQVTADVGSHQAVVRTPR